MKAMEICLPSRALNSILNQSTVAFWNSNIRSTVGEALLLYRRMKLSGISPDHLTFPFLLKSCAKFSNANLPKIIHSHILKSPFSSDVFVATALLDLYAKTRLLSDAEHVFDEMPHRDVVAWNAILTGLAGDIASHGRLFFLFQKMRFDEIKPDSITIISLAQSCAHNQESLYLLKSVHSIGIRIGFENTVSVSNTLIASYSKCEDLDSAKLMFREIPQATKSVVSWNSIIAGFGYLRRSDEIALHFIWMLRGAMRPDLSTILSLLSAFGHSEDFVLGKLVHSLSIKAGFDLDICVSNTLISLYSKSGDVFSARYCFDRMTDRNLVSWTAIISGYSKAGDINEAMNLFHEMEKMGERADAVTVIAILSVCSMTGSVECGRSMERYVMLNNRLMENIMVFNGLIDMYAKCGCISDARRVFETMKGRNVVSWTTLIAGCAMNGDFEDALSLFSLMIEQNLKPNHVTFLSVLQACTHGGLLERGRELFNVMAKVYCVEPRLEHYACMADLLGRRGELKEALEFIIKMPVEPDCGVWGALLGSCIVHGETEVGEYAASRLFELDPNIAAPYVAMANIYASNERWEGVAKIRMMMRRKGLKKSGGRSIVQVNGEAHSFFVDDRVHPENSIIYEVLDSLSFHLKVAQQMDDLFSLL